MKPVLDISKIESSLEWLEKTAEYYNNQQSISWYCDHIGLLCISLAFVNGQMAVAQENLNKRKVKAYETLTFSGVANQKYFSPSLAKDYIASKCHQEQYEYDICERCSRTLYHTIEALRSILSAMKEEIKTLNYQS